MGGERRIDAAKWSGPPDPVSCHLVSANNTAGVRKKGGEARGGGQEGQATWQADRYPRKPKRSRLGLPNLVAPRAWTARASNKVLSVCTPYGMGYSPVSNFALTAIPASGNPLLLRVLLPRGEGTIRPGKSQIVSPWRAQSLAPARKRGP